MNHDISSIDNEVNTLYNQYATSRNHPPYNPYHNKLHRHQHHKGSCSVIIPNKTKSQEQEEHRFYLKRQKAIEAKHKMEQHLMTVFNIKNQLTKAKEEEKELNTKKRLSTSLSKDKRDHFLKTYKDKIIKKNKAELEKLKETIKLDLSRCLIEDYYECKSKRDSCAQLLHERERSLSNRKKHKENYDSNRSGYNKKKPVRYGGLNKKRIFNDKYSYRKIGNCVYLYEENAQMRHNAIHSYRG